MRIQFLLFPLLLLAIPALARDLPADGLRANLGAIDYPFVQLAGKTVRLAPGARIFDRNNHLVLPNTYSGRAPVLYKLDIRGDVQDIWLLTAEEVAALGSKKKTQ
jgi:hypothetical protein